MEFAVYSLFRIEIRSLVKNRFLICKEYHIPPSEINSMIFFEYEWLIEDIKEIQKEQQTQQEAQEKQNVAWQQSMKNPMKNVQLPKMPSFSMPKF